MGRVGCCNHSKRGVNETGKGGKKGKDRWSVVLVKNGRGIQMGSPIVRKEMVLLFRKTRAGPAGRKEYGGGFRKEPERKRKNRWKKRKKS